MRARRHLRIPGHQIAMPVMLRAAAKNPPETIDETARIPHEQVHMQLGKEADRAKPEGTGGPQILSRVRIDKPLIGVSCRAQRNDGSFARVLPDLNARDGGTGVRPLRCRQQFVAPQARSGNLHNFWLRQERRIEFAIEDGQTAAEAHDEYVESERDSGPQMNLEQSLAQPNGLRSLDPLLPGIHDFCLY